MSPILVLSLSSLALFLSAAFLPLGQGLKANRKSEVLHPSNLNQLDLDSARMIVWEAFSNTFLDTSFDEDQLDQFAKTIADSPFCAAELAHILVCEVAPVCFSNAFEYPGGEWAGFANLKERCLPLKIAKPYKPGKEPDKLSPWIHFSVFFACDGYFLLHRALAMRAQ